MALVQKIGQVKLGGMLMLFRSDLFSRLSGFDEGYFLYYEDGDICPRVWKAGSRGVACPAASVIHDARRASHRNWRHLPWHLGSMACYFHEHGRRPKFFSSNEAFLQ